MIVRITMTVARLGPSGPVGRTTSAWCVLSTVFLTPTHTTVTHSWTANTRKQRRLSPWPRVRDSCDSRVELIVIALQHDAEGLPLAVRADRALAAVEDHVVVHREVLSEVVAAHALAPAVVHPCHTHET